MCDINHVYLRILQFSKSYCSEKSHLTPLQLSLFCLSKHTASVQLWNCFLVFVIWTSLCIKFCKCQFYCYFCWMSKEWKQLRPSLPSSQDSSGLHGDSSPGLSSSKRLSKSNIDISAPNEGHSQSRPPLSRKQSDSYDGDSSSTGQRCFFSRWGEMRGCGHTWSQEKMEKPADKFRGADSQENSQEQHGGKGREATNAPTAPKSPSTSETAMKRICSLTPAPGLVSAGL